MAALEQLLVMPEQNTFREGLARRCEL